MFGETAHMPIRRGSDLPRSPHLRELKKPQSPVPTTAPVEAPRSAFHIALEAAIGNDPALRAQHERKGGERMRDPEAARRYTEVLANVLAETRKRTYSV